MTREIRCPICGTKFIPKGKNQYGIQKYCSKKCNREADKKRREKGQRKATQGNAVKRPKIKTTKKEVTSLNGLNGDLKAINKYRDLSQKVCILMRKNRIKKYRKDTQNIILDLMKACSKHLNNELNKKDVVEVDWCES